MTKQTVLITGGAGFIGSHLADAFVARGDRVLVVDDLSSGDRANVPAAAELHELDIRGGEAARLVEGAGVDLLVHQAAQMDVRRSVAEPLFDADVNGPCQAQLLGVRETPWVPGGRGLVLPRNRDGIGVVSFGSVLADGRPLEIESVAADEEQVWRGTRELATLRQLLATVEWGELDALVVDLPPGTERTLQLAQALGALPVLVALVLVTIPSDLSRGVVARSVTALAERGTRVLGYLENMDGYLCRGCGEVRPLFPASATALDLPCLGHIPFDPALAALGGDAPPPAIRAAAQFAERSLPDQLAAAISALG